MSKHGQNKLRHFNRDQTLHRLVCHLNGGHNPTGRDRLSALIPQLSQLFGYIVCIVSYLTSFLFIALGCALLG